MTRSTQPKEEEGTGAFRALIDDVRADVDARLEAWLEPRVTAALAVSADVGAAARIVAEFTRRGAAVALERARDERRRCSRWSSSRRTS